MTHSDMIRYINILLQCSNMKLSELGERSVKERFSKSEEQGGYSKYWKETSLEDALANKNKGIK